MNEPLDLDDLKAKALKATPGPWGALSTGVRNGDHWHVCDAGESIALVAANDGAPDDRRRENAEHIAAFDPPTVLALIERVERAEAVIEKVDDYVTQHHLDTTVGKRVFEITAAYYKPTNQEGSAS